MRFHWGYAVAAGVVFVIEILIGLYLNDAIIRPYVGDSLAVVLVYLSLRAVTPWRVLPALVATLAFAVAIEFGQLFHLIELLGLKGNAAARFILGGVFDLRDFIAYAAGAVITGVAERIHSKLKPQNEAQSQ